MPATEILQTDVLGSVVVSVVLVPALLTTERFTRPIVAVGKPARRTPLGRVPRVNLYDPHAILLSLVLNILVEASERPDVLPRRFWDVLPNMRQVLEHDV